MSAQVLDGVDLQLGDAINQIGLARFRNINIPFDETFNRHGFETFHLNVPDALRGQLATLKFKLQGSTNEVYLDNVFFKSTHLQFGNPGLLISPPGATPELRQEARFDEINQPDNYLIERPQYSLSYNNSKKIPNWVSWQLN